MSLYLVANSCCYETEDVFWIMFTFSNLCTGQSEARLSMGEGPLHHCGTRSETRLKFGLYSDSLRPISFPTRLAESTANSELANEALARRLWFTTLWQSSHLSPRSYGTAGWKNR